MIQYETLRNLRARLGFIRWHICGWYTVNHSIAHILVTLYLTDTNLCYIEYCVLQSRPANHTWAHSRLLQLVLLTRKSILSFHHTTNFFFLQPKSNDHRKFQKHALIQVDQHQFSDFILTYIFHKTFIYWHLTFTFNIAIFNMNLFKRRNTLKLRSNLLTMSNTLQKDLCKNLFLSIIKGCSQPIFQKD